MTQTSRMINGAEAMAAAFDLAGVRIAYTFPITPQSEVMDFFAERAEFTCINADSEYNVLAGAEGVLWSGQRCAVATARSVAAGSRIRKRSVLVSRRARTASSMEPQVPTPPMPSSSVITSPW